MNPFEDPDARYYALVNDEGQYSLWPVFAAVPGGWTVEFGEGGRQECLDFIETNWTDMRPNSLIAAMDAARSSASLPIVAVRLGQYEPIGPAEADHLSCSEHGPHPARDHHR